MRFVLLLLLLLLPGCAVPSNVTDTFEIDAASYDQAFDASRQVLRSYRFHPDRVDARAGLISTEPKTTAGLATPWDLEQSTLQHEISDLGNDQRRFVRVTFIPQEAPETEDFRGAPIPDVRRAEGPIDVRVQVYVERLRTPGVRLDATKINLSSRTLDPDLRTRNMFPTYVQTLHRDDAFARRLSYAIQNKLESTIEKPRAN